MPTFAFVFAACSAAFAAAYASDASDASERGTTFARAAPDARRRLPATLGRRVADAPSRATFGGGASDRGAASSPAATGRVGGGYASYTCGDGACAAAGGGGYGAVRGGAGAYGVYGPVATPAENVVDERCGGYGRDERCGGRPERETAPRPASSDPSRDSRSEVREFRAVPDAP